MTHSYKSGEITKTKIIEATGKLAAEIGLAQVTIGKIAQFSGENKGTIHYHFKGRENLLEAVFRKIIDHWDKQPYNEIIEFLDSHPNEKQCYAKAIEWAIEWQINELFTDKKPEWYRRLLYQGLETKVSLKKLIVDEVFHFHNLLLQKIFTTIDPSLSKEELFILAITTTAPIFLLAKEEEDMAVFVNTKTFGSSFLKNLRKLSVKKLCKTFDLPIP